MNLFENWLLFLGGDIDNNLKTKKKKTSINPTVGKLKLSEFCYNEAHCDSPLSSGRYLKSIGSLTSWSEGLRSCMWMVTDSMMLVS